MKRFDRFKDAAEIVISFDSVSDRRLYLTADNKYSVTVSFDQVLNKKCSLKYARYSFDCDCTHAAMRTEQMQGTCNLCKHCLAAIAWLVKRKGKWKK